MKNYIILSILFLFPLCAFSASEAMLEKLGLTKDCDIAAEKISDKEVNELQKAYLHKIQFLCIGRELAKANKNDEILKAKAAYERKVNNLVASAMASGQAYESSLLELITLLPLTPQNNELVRKSYTTALLDNPPSESGEHVFKPEEFVFNQYKSIADKYYSSGMKEEGKRIIEELGDLPQQNTGDIQELESFMNELYQKWSFAQNASRGPSTKAVEEKKPDEEALTSQLTGTNNTAEDSLTVVADRSEKNEASESQESNKSGMLFSLVGICALILVSVLGLLFWNRRR